jgi:heat shock protein HslJ
LAILIPLLGGWAAATFANETSGTQMSESPRVMRGMYRYMADAALFMDCESGRSLPVAMEGDNRALERAYLQMEHEPGEALLVTLAGRIVPRMPMEGPGPVATLLPERFLGIRPRASCDSPVASADLLGTYWKLTHLEQVEVVYFTDQREPHIVLHGDNRVTGSDGCNLLNGSFRHEDDSLVFSQVAMTRMVCPQGMAQQQEFGEMLGSTARYRIVNGFLELRGDDDIVLARFQAIAASDADPWPGRH